LLAAGTAAEGSGQEADLDALPAKDDAYRVEIRPARRIEAYGAVTFHVPNMTVHEWCLLGPKPPVLPSQHPIESHMEPAGRVVFDLSPEHRPLYRALVPGGGMARHTHEVEFFFRGVLYSRKLVVRQGDAGEPRHPELRPALREHFLRETKLLDFKAPSFVRWLERNHLQRQPEEGDIHLARRVYLAIKREFKDGPGTPPASKMVETHVGDCGGLANVFLSALRANGIPARALCGRWAGSAYVIRKTGVLYFQGHVKTDFFARGVGWIPVDPYCAVQFDKGAFDSFGNDHGDFITFNVDRDLIVPTEIDGRQVVRALPGPDFFTRGEGSLKDASRGEQRWEVHVERLDSLPAGVKEEPLDDPPVAKDDPPRIYQRPALPPPVPGGVFRVEYRPDRLDVWRFFTSTRNLEQARTIAGELRQMGYPAIVVHGGPPGPLYERSYAFHERGTVFRDPWWRSSWWNEHHHSYHWHPYEHRVIHHHDHPTPHPHGGGSGHPLR
jgi:hypothetical protein